MNHAGVVKTANDVDNRVHLADVRKKFVAQPLPRARALHKAGDVDKFQNRITKYIDELREKELDLDEVDFEVDNLGKFAKRLESEFEVNLGELIFIYFQMF
jgi:hypothetical protein